MSTPDPAALRDTAEAIAREAGALLQSRFRRSAEDGLEVRGERNPVTDADRDSEALIVERIKTRFPGHTILGEEGTASQPAEALAEAGRSGICWIVDPLDGTVNFVHGHPFYCVSIGVVSDGDPIAGVIHCPSLDEHFAAAKGAGATLNGQPIRVNPGNVLLEEILATGFPYNRSTAEQNNFGQAEKLSIAARGVRRNGAAAIDLAYVAAGIYGGFWEYWLSPWDVAAGALLVTEAGGRVTDVAGGANWLFGRNILASNGLLHDAIGAHLEPFRGA